MCIALVISGTFQYRSDAGRECMTPGSLLLGNADQCFECGHEHGAGDRCVSFRFAPEYLEALASESAAPAGARFQVLRLPPLREFSPVAAAVLGGIEGSPTASWEELAVVLATRTLQVLGNCPAEPRVPSASAVARVAGVIREMEQAPAFDLPLAAQAAAAGLSRYHFLRTFKAVTGLTPHQYTLRTRLREVAARLRDSAGDSRQRILDVALDSGFGDLSAFNRAFRAEFGMSPRAYRATKET